MDICNCICSASNSDLQFDGAAGVVSSLKLWALLQLGVIAIALMLMLRIITLEDALKGMLGLIAGFILIECLVGILHAAWLSMPYWRRAAVVAVGIMVAVGSLAAKTARGGTRRN